MENVTAVISGQSSLRSSSRRRRLVRNRVTFEGPGAGAAGWGFSDDGLRLVERKLRDLAREELLVDEDILERSRCAGTVITWYLALICFS